MSARCATTTPRHATQQPRKDRANQQRKRVSLSREESR
ncbi:hypothetical protein GLE_2257 [Lysobacter enzymogenes]|uniref:Uncharacterized protein n=1 Tax=Lysobacter enzymogenes TaxID=69 RepID=A0A0S2DG44_LYSEN|nr:hypothetical protein GLE_2257 [Lysobacter enzymogenes]